MRKNLRYLFGQRVKEFRIAIGLSQEAFADRCGFARSYMSRIERGCSNASLDAIEVLADALRIEPWQLLASDSRKPDDQEVLVPYAADGSCFHPGLASTRDGSFRVGENQPRNVSVRSMKLSNTFVEWKPRSGVGLMLVVIGELYLRLNGID